MGSSRSDTQRNMAPWLAAFFTFLYVVVPVVAVAASADERPLINAGIVLLVVAALTLVIYLFRRLFPNVDVARDMTAFIFRERTGNDPLADYQPKKKSRRRVDRYGTNKPPTVDRVREIREESATTTWVPRSKR